MRPMALLAEGKGKHCASTGYWPTTKAIGSCGWSLARPDHLITSAFQVSWMSILRHKIPSAPRARRGPADRLDCRCPGLQSVLWARPSSADRCIGRGGGKHVQGGLGRARPPYYLCFPGVVDVHPTTPPNPCGSGECLLSLELDRHTSEPYRKCGS